MTPTPQTSAPDFTLTDQTGKSHTLSDYRGTWVLLYFYPKDDTPGCTKQACMLRDAWPDFDALHIQVFGISKDSEKSHQKFIEKYSLPFTLLADTEHTAADSYGVWQSKKFMGREYMGMARTSFLIDPEGNIDTVYENVKPETHAQEVLATLRTKNI